MKIDEIVITYEDLNWFMEKRQKALEIGIDILFFTKSPDGKLSAIIKPIILSESDEN